MKKIDIDKIRSVAIYDPETGIIYRKSSGASAVRTNIQGYGKVCFLGMEIIAHRLAWALHYGDWPTGQLDHINGIRDDNRIENLRAVSLLENARNKAIPKNNTSGFIGVGWNKRKNKWQAYIAASGTQVYLGVFSTLEEAVAARSAAEIVYGFHENHCRLSNFTCVAPSRSNRRKK